MYAQLCFHSSWCCRYEAVISLDSVLNSISHFSKFLGDEVPSLRYFLFYYYFCICIAMTSVLSVHWLKCGSSMSWMLWIRFMCEWKASSVHVKVSLMCNWNSWYWLNWNVPIQYKVKKLGKLPLVVHCLCKKRCWLE